MRLTKDEVRRFFAEDSLLHGTSAETIDRLSELALQRVVGKGESLFRMGQECRELFFVAEGCARLVKGAPDGRERILHRAVPGDVVAALPFFDGKGYPASFVAETECVVLGLPRPEFLKLLSRDATLALSIIGVLTERLRLMSNLIEQLSFEDSVHRLWDFLVDNSSPSSTNGEYPRVFEGLPTREYIASSIGTVREVVSRQLSKLVGKGLIRIDGRRLTLLEPLE